MVKAKSLKYWQIKKISIFKRFIIGNYVRLWDRSNKNYLVISCPCYKLPTLNQDPTVP